MKVVYLKNIPKIAKKFDIKEVSDGHALNHLIPQGIAKLATPAVLKQVEVLKTAEAAERKVQEDLLIMDLKQIDGQTVTLTEKANAKGHLFAGIHTAEIIPAVFAQTRVNLLPEFIHLDKPIKEVGEHTINIKVQDKHATFKLVVEAK